jgi:hypothetical protein
VEKNADPDAPQTGPFLFPPAPSRIVYAVGSAPGAVSRDDGRSWEACGVSFDDVTAAALAPEHPQVLYAAVRGGGMMVSRDGCRTWAESNVGLGNRFVNSIAPVPNHGGRLFAAADAGIYISSDGGARWMIVGTGLSDAPIAYSIVVDEEGNILAATPEGFFRLEEG